jgi:hypothetical protein
MLDIDQDGLLVPDWLPKLDKGRHAPHRSQVCAMEAAAWLAGEEWSDHPRSVHRVIAQAARVTNDTMSDDERQELWPLVLASVGTGAPWRPLLLYRLARHQLRLQRKYPGNPRKVWEELLKEHARVTGPQHRSTSGRRIGSLAAHLRAGEASDVSLDAVRDTTAGQFLTVDPFVDETGQAYVYSGVDSLNESDLSGS